MNILGCDAVLIVICDGSSEVCCLHLLCNSKRFIFVEYPEYLVFRQPFSSNEGDVMSERTTFFRTCMVLGGPVSHISRSDETLN